MKYYSNEIVFRGHPDKCCDQISGAILNDLLLHDVNSRAGIEVMIKNDKIFITGEITSSHKPDYKRIAIDTMRDIGYTEDYEVITEISCQSADIALGVDKKGAGDQGMMFGYACNDTPQLLPKAMVILQEFSKWYDEFRRNNTGVYPDGKAQITGIYDKDFKLVKIDTFLVSYCNDEEHREIYDYRIISKIKWLCKKYELPEPRRILINPTGKFKIGGSFADAGLTGRKIVVDAYQSFANVGGGCMNGKDPTKVDFSGAHMARDIAKRFLKKYNLKWCEVQLSYAIGKSRPLAIYIDSDKGNFKPNINLYFQCEPHNIIKRLNLSNINYMELAKFGHFTK